MKRLKSSLSASRLTIPFFNYLEEIKKCQNNIVLFGSVGNGKTSLLNKMCGLNKEIRHDGYSCTRKVDYGFSLKYDMIIIDFPGLNSVQDIMGHLNCKKQLYQQFQ